VAPAAPGTHVFGSNEEGVDADWGGAGPLVGAVHVFGSNDDGVGVGVAGAAFPQVLGSNELPPSPSRAISQPAPRAAAVARPRKARE